MHTRQAHHIIWAASAAVGLASIPSLAASTTYNWADTNSDWTTPGNWNPRGIPADGDFVNIINADAINRTIIYDYANSSAGYPQILVQNTGGGTDTLTMTVGQTLVANTEDVGGYLISFLNGPGAGAMTQPTGTNSVATLNLGFNNGDVGSYTLSGTSVLSSTTENIGLGGTATFSQAGGTNGSVANALGISNATVNVGVNAGSVGAYTLAFGTVNVSGNNINETIGVSGTGTFNQSGGNNNIGSSTSFGFGADTLYVGYNAGAAGFYNLSGGSLTGVNINSNAEVIGYSGTGNFNHTSGVNEPSSNGLFLGYNAGSSGSYTLSGFGLITTGALFETVGLSGVGNFLQTGGTNDFHNGGSLTIGANAGGVGAYTLSGTGTMIGAGFAEYAGYSGTGSFTQTGGSNKPGQLIVGFTVGSTGTYSLSGTGVLTVSQTEIIGYGFAPASPGPSAGTFTQSGGTNTLTGATNALYLGYLAGATGSYTLSNTGTLSVPGAEVIGNNGVGLFRHTAGANTTGTLSIAANAGATGSYLLSGTGSLTAPQINVGGASTAGGRGLLSVSGGSVNVSSTITVYGTTGSSLSVSGGAVTATAMDLAGGTFTQSAGSATFAQINGGGQVSITGGKTTLSPGVNISQVNSLSVAAPGILDLTNNAIVVNFPSPASDPLTAITAALTTGYNAGRWTGAGITSSTAAAGPRVFAVGYDDGNTDTGPAGLNQFLIAYTLAADANLDGSVGFPDLVVVAQNFGFTGKDWSQGNFTYDPAGSVGFADVVLIAQLFSDSTPIAASAGGALTLSPAWQANAAALPEPTAAAALSALCTAALLRRRRRRP